MHLSYLYLQKIEMDAPSQSKHAAQHQITDLSNLHSQKIEMLYVNQRSTQQHQINHAKMLTTLVDRTTSQPIEVVASPSWPFKTIPICQWTAMPISMDVNILMYSV
jgi:hypothetical protein